MRSIAVYTLTDWSFVKYYLHIKAELTTTRMRANTGVLGGLAGGKERQYLLFILPPVLSLLVSDMDHVYYTTRQICAVR
jgi:hypothetical protein